MLRKSKYGGNKDGLGFYELMVVPRNIFNQVITAINEERTDDFYRLLGVTPSGRKSKGRNRKRILIMEDRLELAHAVNESLSRRGFNVTYTSENKKLQEVESMGIDLIIIDLTFHGADALQLCRKIRGNKHTSGIPIIIINGYEDEGHIIAGLEAGADDYLGKGFSLEELSARVKAVLRSYE